jgi:hypothetical protein
LEPNQIFLVVDKEDNLAYKIVLAEKGKIGWIRVSYNSTDFIHLQAEST